MSTATQGESMLKLSPHQFGKIFETLRAAGSSRGSEKRQATRIDVQTKLNMAKMVDGNVVRCYSALTRDISCTGLGFFQFAPLANGEKFLVCFPFGKEELVVVCSSMFCRPLAEGMFGIGAQFECAADAKMIEQLKQLRSGDVDRIRASILA
jgi:hypothetical protein